ncbi:MAG: hypothetical protein GEU90_21115 [Gemmatimonas sp.]|nr:hypothetical protein [Gemmatimonas sp.]
MAKASLELISAMYEVAESTQPITGRGVGYKLFSMGLIPSMSTKSMKQVYRLLKIARERGVIPWEWIVDETRSLEKRASWSDPADYVRAVRRSYRLDFWEHQDVDVELWSEKGTVRGVLAPVLDEYGVGFRVMHGFSSATSVHDVACEWRDRPLIILYVGDFDPSGLYMSKHDLPDRLERYGGDLVILKRIALLSDDLDDLPSFPAASKAKDSRHNWYVRYFGSQCWELDAMDPNDLRDRVRDSIVKEIEPEAWDRCVRAQEAEQESLEHLLDAWIGEVDDD